MALRIVAVRQWAIAVACYFSYANLVFHLHSWWAKKWPKLFLSELRQIFTKFANF